MEEVYTNTSKVLVDVEGGGNMMYLPLDKIIQQQNYSRSNSNNEPTVESLREQSSRSVNSQPSSGLRPSSSRGGRN
jgi:membrane protease subunit HflK